MSKEKVVLAYSGGLDTSVCIKWLQEAYGLDVIALVGDVGQEHEGLEKIRKKALKTGAIACEVIDMKEEFANEFLAKAMAANALYENKYPLLSALSRPLISKHLVEVAHRYGAQYIAHGCTGKGNDQVRFEASVLMLDPSLQIIAPVREWDLRTRSEEADWALERGIEVPVTKDALYSIDDNLWGRAIECGALEDPWNEAPDDIWTMTSSLEDAPAEAEYVELEFSQGLPCALNGIGMSFLDIIYALNGIAGKHGFGRLDMIENRLVGVKSRECYEVPAGLALILAHKALEDVCLEREVLHYKLGIEQSWATAVYNGQWFSPLKEALDAFCATTQGDINGTVRLKFYKGNCIVVGRKSESSLYDFALATYDEEDVFDHKSAKGFINLQTLSTKVWATKHLSAEKQSVASCPAGPEGAPSGLIEEAEEVLNQSACAKA
ncbi:MAG: argininosuccinate synthase [Coriobacteriaceae bacterium]|nr:argininosuccinate synthase [Coriobacteriaceae bacterium]